MLEEQMNDNQYLNKYPYMNHKMLTKYLDLMLAHRRRHRPNIKQALDERLVFP